jgi:hypothetical protein
VLAEHQLTARPRPRAWHRYWAIRSLPLFAVLGLALWIVAPRFRLTAPSLVDDWYAVTYSPASLHALLRGDYLSSGLDFDGRYRPAYSAVWSYAQWHLFGDPSPAMAAAWGVLRVAFFVLAAWLLTSFVASRESTAPRAALWLAPFAVALTPAIAVDLARFGPGEPIMVAGLIVGLALITRGARALFLEVLNRQRRTLAVGTIATGYLVYLLGVYSKESSFCLLAFAPFLLMWLGPSVRTALRSRTTRVPYLILGVLIVAPLLHVGTRLALAVLGGADPYPNPEYGLTSKLFSAGLSPLLGEPGALGTWMWFFIAPASVIVALSAATRRQRDAWLVFGVLLTGFLMSSIALIRGPTPSWYYVPWLVAVAAVAFRGLSSARVGVHIGLAILLVALAGVRTRPALMEWSRSERSSATAIELSKSVIAADCRLYAANFDIEQRVALPLLFRFAAVRPIPDCRESAKAAYTVSWRADPLPSDFAARCRGRWQVVTIEDKVSLLRCSSFRPGTILDQNAASGHPLVTVVRVRPQPEPPSPIRLFRAAG